jgi:fatty-acyl-CoA synthase
MAAYDYPLLLKQLWHTPLVQADGQEIVYRDLKRFTFRELYERIGRLASGLSALGIAPGDTVGVLDWDSNRFLEALWAVPMMGAILHTVNVHLTPEQLAYTIDQGGASVLLVNDDFAPVLGTIRDRLPKVKRLVRMSDKAAPAASLTEFDCEYEGLLARASSDFEFADFPENHIATTFFTSGTTGLPKAVRFSHRQLVLHTLSELAFFGIAAQQGRFSRDDVYMPLTPMYHAHAWGMPWTATLAGAKQVYAGRYDPAMLIKLIKSEGVTFTHGVPTLLQRLLDAAADAKTDLAGLKMIVGGSELSRELARRAMEFGVDVAAGYGMSESAPTLAVAQVKSADLGGDGEIDIRTKSGLAAPLVDLHLVDSSGRRLPNDGQARGEIVVRAPWLTQDYPGNASASEQLWAGGVMHTGDIGVIDPDGYLRIVDRIKDVIKTGGEWVSSIQLEDLISQCRGVTEAAVIAVRDERWGERPLALVVRDDKADTGVTEAQIKAHLKAAADSGAIPKFAIPDRFIFLDALPRTSVGKFDKKKLRETYGDLPTADPPATSTSAITRSANAVQGTGPLSRRSVSLRRSRGAIQSM